MRVSLTVLLVAGLALFLGAQPANALQLGFNGEDLLRQGDPQAGGVDDAGLAMGLQRGREAGAQVWRLQLRWADIAVQRPETIAATADPAWGGYRWEPLDRQVRAVSAAGFTPLLWMNYAPKWAQAEGGPSPTALRPDGSWRPSPEALGALATAMAIRYRGDYPDPARPGSALPRVGTYQAWNEPNLYTELNPQYVRTAGREVPASPTTFRDLVNAVYDAVKAVDPSARVGAGATAPFGDYPAGGNRVPPATFWRTLLCVQASTLRASKRCPKVRFDFFSHNPYSPAAPTRAALNPDDVTVPDLGKLRAVVDAAAAAGTILPRGDKPLWITELGWDTAPDPNGVSFQRQATYVQGAISVLAKSGADVILLWNMRDDPPVPSFDTTFQAGIFSRGSSVAADTRKPSYTAFRFPFTAYRERGRVLLWGKAPAPGPVTVQRRRGTRWATVTTLSAKADGVFSRRLNLPRASKLRAVQGANTSLVWTSR